MTPLHQQLLDAIRELDILRESIAYANELSIRLDNEERELAMLEELIPREQQDVDRLEKNGSTSLVRTIIGDREEKITKEREDYEKVSQRHIEIFKSIKLITFELDVLKQKEDQLKVAEEKAAFLMQEREKELALSDVTNAGIIKHLTEESIKHNGHFKKVENLNTFGRSNLASLISIENLLDEARSLHLSSKAGSTPQSYDELENASRLVQKTTLDLVRFKKDLINIFPHLHLSTRIKIEHFGSYADRPIITSTKAPTFLEKIKKSRINVHNIREQLEIVLTFLDQEEEEVRNRISGIEEERRSIVLGAG